MYIRLIIRILISLVVLAPFVLHNRGDVIIPALERLEAFAYDARLVLTMPQTPDDRVVIVDIDEESLTAEGQWPWGRNKLAQLVNNLFDKYQVKVVGFDVVFPEPDRGSGLAVLASLAEGSLSTDTEFIEQLPQLRDSLDWDNIFARSLNERATVMGYVFREDNSTASIGGLPAPVLNSAGNEINFHTPKAHTGNYGVLQNAALTGGFFDNPTVDEDGVYRRVPVLQQFDGKLYESLALAVTRAAVGFPDIEFVFHSGDKKRDSLNLDWLNVGPYQIPVDGEATVLVPYRGAQYSFPYISATKILNGTAPMYPLKGAIALVGTSAPGLLDLRVTPVGEKYNGVEVHANIVSGILDGRIKHHPHYVQGVEFTLLLLTALLVTWVMARANVVTGTLFTILVLVSLASVNLLLWDKANFVVPLAPVMTLAFVLYLFHLIYGYVIETRGKRQLSTMFGQYVPPELVEEMDENHGFFDMKSESREMTVLFSDIRGFTTISESLKPRDLSTLMNDYLTPMTRVIHSHRGTIDKYMGDAIMAFWGAPLEDPDHSRHALEAALQMQVDIDQLNEEFSSRGWPRIKIGIGLNSGIMRVGNMGSAFRMAYTVMGDAVNLGSRIEGLTKKYGIGIAVGQATVKAVPDHAFLEIDLVRVKGKDRPVAIYEPLGPLSELSGKHKTMLKQHARALKMYRAGEWDTAEQALFNLHQSHPGRDIFQTYLDRIAYYRNNPPGDDWDGVFTHQTK
ncbi:MAG: adenylate/guanylate cyclase domain-containing protein [Gammaproteobacteria bacterium]|nr:adenylate/guanylate cyclase domain-containing protein [Gammaproteobacteria bacterium]NNF62565.1 adenylate/guanylate cyclase domain-containing protein [Gammaproteobacteria bacterium]NNM20732.1 adenylate/guanylate cyclase domain-containing protein [Gammaproteobacteria bacterium]